MESISTETLLRFVPHRAPMVWIDEVLAAEPISGKCRLTLDANSLYFGSEGVLQCAPIEWMAQTAAFSAARRWSENPHSKPLKDAYLVGIRDAWLSDLRVLRPGDVVEISASVLKELPPLTLIEASVNKEGVVIAKAVLKLFGQS